MEDKERANKVFNLITMSIIIMCSIGMLGTFLSDYLININWFGDYEILERVYGSSKKEIVKHWGSRHYWYNWAIFLLFTLSVIRSFTYVVLTIEDKN